MNQDLEIVYLSDLKLFGTTSNTQAPDDINTSDPTPVWSASDRPLPAISRSKPHQRLAADKIGEELAPDAGIWQIYLDEAKEYDDELVNGKNENLDMMLLFAALFSAILTAFLIESKNLLQQDSTEVTIGLLLTIAQSQQRLEQGNPRLTPAPIQLPRFSASMSARWINGLWFMSLALSLSAALIAMLAKEWLTAYNTSRPRPPHTYALLRQARLVGLTKWRALHIIDLLPSILHLALLLFSFGLILYLSQLDSGIAAVIGVVTGGTFLFYVATTFSGAIYGSCPFVTQISAYIREALIFYAETWMTGAGGLSKRDKHPHDDTTDDDLCALLWLAENARDPSAGDCSYQALAGLRLKPSKDNVGSAAHDVPEKPASVPNNDQSPENPPNQYNLVHDLFESVCTHLSLVAIQQPRELIACQGMNAARYANALPKLVEFLQGYLYQQMFSKGGDKINPMLMSETPARVALAALDNIWRDDCPALSPDSYALLTSAELRLTEAVVLQSSQLSPPSTTMGTTNPEPQLPTPAPAKNENETSQTYIGIPMDSVQELLPESSVSLFDLRARYSRALSRAAYLLRFHDDGMDEGQTLIYGDALTHLLDSIRTTARCAHLNPKSQLSTHQPQSPSRPTPIFKIRVIGKGHHLYTDPNGIGEDGLLVGILRLLASTAVLSNTVLEHAAGSALNAIAPVLLNQWLNLTEPPTENDDQAVKSKSRLTLDQWSQHTNPIRGSLGKDREDPDTDWAAWQALGIALVIVPYAGRSGIDELPERAISTLFKRLKNDPNRWRAYGTFCGQYDLIGQLISLVDQHHSSLSQTTLKTFINIFSLTYQDVTFLDKPGISRENILPLLRTLVKAQGQVSGLQSLIGKLDDHIQSSIFFFWSFVRFEGFSSLLQMKEHVDYQLIAAKCVGRIIERITHWGWGWDVQTEVVPEFFDAVSFALKALSDDNKISADLLSLMRSTVTLLRLFPIDPSYATSYRAGIATVRSTMQANIDPSEEQASLMTELEELESWLDIDDVPVRGFVELFEQNEEREITS